MVGLTDGLKKVNKSLFSYDILNLVSEKGKMLAKLRKIKIKTDLVAKDYASTIGSALGKTLANIKDYDNAGDFAFDLSKKAAITGTIKLIATKFPILAIMMITGGYSLTFYQLYNNDVIDNELKLKQIGLMTLDMGTKVGASLLGAVVGQTLIPIPIVGAFIGSVFGGFVGSVGATTLVEGLETIHFNHMVDNL